MLTLLAFMFAAVMAFGLGGSAMAQELPPVFCGDLSEADCEILAGVQAASQELNAADFEFDFELGIDGGDEVGAFKFGLAGDGAFITDPDAVAAFTPEALAGGDPAALAALYGELLGGIDAELNLSLALDEALLAELGGGELGLDGLALEMRLVGGVGYLNMDALAAQDPTGGQLSGAFGEGWLGIDFVELFEVVLSQADAFGGFDGGAGFIPDDSLLDAINNPDFAASFTMIERLEDVVSDGQTLAVFQTTVDAAGLFSNPVFADLIRGQFIADPTLSEIDADLFMQAFAKAIQGEVVVIQQIGLDDLFTHRSEFDMAFTFDIEALASALDQGAVGETSAISLSLSGFIAQSNFNDVPAIQAPEDAFIFPLGALLGPNA